MQARPADLDQDTREYLHRLWSSRGRDGHGVFLSKTAFPAGWALLLLGLAVAVGGLVPSFLSIRVGQHHYLQAAAVGAGVLFLALGAGRLRGRDRRLGSFWFFDALHFWEVTPSRVSATPIDQIVDVRGTHHYTNGVYSHTAMQITTRNGTIHRSVHGVHNAEKVARFLNALIVLRTDPSARSLAENPAMLGALAQQLTQPDRAAESAPVPLDLPRPAVERAAARGGGRALAPLLLAGAAAAAGVAVLPQVNAQVREADLFARAAADRSGDTARHDDYLREFPEGWRSAEVRGGRDDALFTRAKDEATARHSPTTLRQYLADAGNVRHRDEAQGLINGYYDEAIERLTDLAEKTNVNAELFEGFVALLRGLKTAPTPLVTVGFRATQQELPGLQLVKDLEKRQYDVYLQQYPELKRLEEASANRSAVQEVGLTFSPEQTLLRERVILELLRGALAKVMNSDILDLQKLEGGGEPAIQVSYHIAGLGQMYVHTQDQLPAGAMPGDPFAPGGLFPGAARTAKGVLRGYEIDWEIRVRPAGGDKGFEFKVHSIPAQHLSYDYQPSDPEWAPYAVLLHSGFYEMGRQLIRNFGLIPPEARTRFGFQEATGQFDYGSAPLDLAVFPDLVLSREESLAPTDPVDPALGKRARGYDVALQAGQRYAVELESPQFDPYLVLRDPDGATVASDDDGAGNLNARIIYTPEADGVYRVVVTSFDQTGVGAFTLRVAR